MAEILQDKNTITNYFYENLLKRLLFSYLDLSSPTNVKLIALNPIMAFISWEPVNIGNKVVQGYVIDWSTDKQTSKPVVLTTVNYYLFTGLTPGQSIYATVREIPIWQYLTELDFVGPISDPVHVSIPGKIAERLHYLIPQNLYQNSLFYSRLISSIFL